MADHELPDDPVPERLRLLKSPLKDEPSFKSVSDEQPQNSAPEVQRPSHGAEPVLKRHADATNLEVFYDLFLACLNLFNQNQQVATLSGLSAYIGFFCVLWSTWLLTSMYDVRFITDSIFSRCTRAVHLGVLIGFAVVSPNFDPGQQEPEVFRTFSIILMVSRLCLALEYGLIIFHLRSFKTSRLPLIIMVVQNIVAGAIYLGITFRFDEDNSRVFYAWYIMAALELVSNIAVSIYFRVLTFQGTHLIRRLSLLTLIILGEGIAITCNGVTRIVNIGHDQWTPKTIGVTAACVATIYVVFMVYFDWMRHSHLPGWRQLSWSMIHFPLHLCMTLFMEGCAQFIIFWRVVEIETDLLKGYLAIVNEGTPEVLLERLQEWIKDFVTTYKPTYSFQIEALQKIFGALESIDFVAMFERLAELPPAERMQDPEVLAFDGNMTALIYTMDNIVYNILGVDYVKDATGNVTDPSFDAEELSNLNFLEDLSERSYNRFRTVFQYTFVSAGVFLALANLLYCISHIEKWHRWNVARVVANTLLALGIGLVACVSQNLRHLVEYQATPWVLPTLLFAYIIVLTMNHLPHSISGLAFPFAKKKGRTTGLSADEELAEQTEYMVTKTG